MTWMKIIMLLFMNVNNFEQQKLETLFLDGK